MLTGQDTTIEIEVWGVGRVHWLVEYSATSMVTLALDYDIDDPEHEPTTHLLIKLHLESPDYDIGWLWIDKNTQPFARISGYHIINGIPRRLIRHPTFFTVE